MLAITAISALAATYVTYVITRSEFPPLLRARDVVFDRWGDGSWQAYLVTCGWCVAAYASAIMTVVAVMAVSVPLPVLVWLAAATVVGLLIRIEDVLFMITRNRDSE